ncbi:Alpha-monoglucosyldiacylglycerol synthase [Acetatifactor muris]|uniref:Alpha-monoglucosyldiacylglycerol synthase n=2 Tax=Acetatifactor muris TaxID=879566 RepID=A0A2K4ZEL7_9FIRM|nr:Alpha-monoglucosyldiacylglycerol synthase [Acetatifactor muris]
MRILHININYLFTALHQTMIEHLTDVGLDNFVFVPIHDKADKKIIPNSNVVVSCCFRKRDRILYFFKQRKILKSAIDMLPISDYNVVHAYTLLSDGNIAMQISKKYGIPYIVTVRGTDLKDFFHLKPYLIPHGIKIMQHAEKIIFISKAYQQNMMHKYVPDNMRKEIAGKSMVIPNGIDDFWLENIFHERDYIETQKRFDKKELKIICVASILKDKNIPFLQKALKKLVEKGWKIQFHLIGNVADKKELNKIEADKYTIYHGSMKKEELIRCYRENDIFALISHTETFGLVYAEAMSQGLPVIYTSGEGFDQQFEDGCVGFSVSDRRVNDAVEKILRIVSDYRGISENCIKKVKNFEWSQIVNNYKELYRDILNG